MGIESLEGLQKHNNFSKCSKCDVGCFEIDIKFNGKYFKLGMEEEEDRIWFAWFCLATTCKPDLLSRARIENAE